MVVALELVGVFLGAALFDALNIAFIHYSQAGKAGRASLSSMAMTVMGLATLGPALLKDWRYSAAYVLGFGFGTWVTVIWKAVKKP